LNIKLIAELAAKWMRIMWTHVDTMEVVALYSAAGFMTNYPDE
jgi:hypothetical protein